MHIFDIIKQNYDIKEEFLEIRNLFNKIKLNYCGFLYTIEELADKNFSKWKGRNTMINCSKYKNKLEQYILKCYSTKKNGINIIDYNKPEIIIIYLEYYINISHFVNSLRLFNLFISNPNDFQIMSENIKILLEHLNYQKINDNDNILLIPKNPEAIAVAEQTKNIEIANAILKYNHYSLKGNLEDKRNLLISIANEYNGFLHSKLAGFNKELDMAIFLINNCHIRHNNKSGNEEKKLIANLKNEDLEKLYDDTYQLILFCILAKTNVERMKNFEEKVKKPIINGGKKCSTQ